MQLLQNVFPLGRSFSILWESYKDEKEYGADITEIGVFEDYITHELKKVESSKCPDQNDISYHKQRIEVTGEKEVRCFTKETNLTRKKSKNDLNPYLIIKVDEKLIPGHNEIWGDEIREVVSSFIRYKVSPRGWEQVGFDKLLKQDLDGAIEAFQQAYDMHPTYHDVDETLDLLKKEKREKEKREKEKRELPLGQNKKIVNKYPWGMPKEVKKQFQRRIKN